MPCSRRHQPASLPRGNRGQAGHGDAGVLPVSARALGMERAFDLPRRAMDHRPHQVRARRLRAEGSGVMIVRCIDNTLQADVLAEGREYESRAERDDYYYLSAFENGSTRTRFDILQPYPYDP